MVLGVVLDPQSRCGNATAHKSPCNDDFATMSVCHNRLTGGTATFHHNGPGLATYFFKGILVGGDLREIAKATRLSQATRRDIRKNFDFAFLDHALGIPIATGLLFGFFGLLLSPISVGAALSLSSVSVMINALRPRNVRR